MSLRSRERGGGSDPENEDEEEEEEEEEEESSELVEEEGSYPEKDRPTRSRRHLPHLWWGEQELGRWGAPSSMELVKKGGMKEGRKHGRPGVAASLRAGAGAGVGWVRERATEWG